MFSSNLNRPSGCQRGHMTVHAVCVDCTQPFRLFSEQKVQELSRLLLHFQTHICMTNVAWLNLWCLRWWPSCMVWVTSHICMGSAGWQWAGPGWGPLIMRLWMKCEAFWNRNINYSNPNGWIEVVQQRIHLFTSYLACQWRLWSEGGSNLRYMCIHGGMSARIISRCVCRLYEWG